MELKQKAELKAVEYAEGKKIKTDCIRFIDTKKHYYDGYIAGATENGIQWHDLRKNPNDLPKNKDVMCICLGQICKRFYPFPTECWIGYYDALGWSDYMGSSLYSNVFYWCEIPQFKEQ